MTGARAVRFARALRARGSAMRLARRRETGSRDGWRGLALRWRRRARRRPAAALNSRTAQAAPVVWSPQFHVHLAPEARRVGRTTSHIFVRPVQVMRQMHHRVQRLFSTVNGTERVAGPVQWLERVRDAVAAAAPRASAPALWLQRSASRRRRSTERVAGSVQWLERIARQDVPAALTHAAPPQLLLPPSTRRPAQRQAHPLALGSRARHSAGAKAAMMARSPFRATLAAHVTGSPEPRQPVTTPIRLDTLRPHLAAAQLPAPLARAVDHLYQPIDIVWSRRRSAAGTSAELESDGRLSSVSGWTAPALPAPAGSRAPVSQQPTPSPASLKLTDIDPRLLDRLTDNVIRRVERHVRIERERRGL